MPRRETTIYLVLLFAVLVIYWPLHQFGFVNFDDYDYVTTNPHMPAGLTWENIRWSFTTFYTSNYFPLTWISLLLDCSLFGINPHAMHMENVLWHAVNSMLLFTIFLKATRQIWPAAFVAAVFAVHPTHVESVAWITERKDVLSTFFMWVALLCYLRYVQSDAKLRWVAYFAMLLSYACALLCKTMPVTLPFLLLLLDYWPLGRTDLRSLRRLTSLALEKTPLLMLAVLISIMTYKSQKSIIAPLSLIPLQLRFGNSMLAYLGYLNKEFWPVGLSVLYPFRTSVSLAISCGAAMALICLSFIFALMARRRPYVIMGWLWFLGALVPVIGIVPVGLQSMADRFLYIPSVGLTVMIAWAGREMARWVGHQLIAILAMIILLLLSVISRHQVDYWRDGHALFCHASIVLNGDSITEVRQGYDASQRGDAAAAMQHYQAALQADPHSYPAELNLGNLLIKDHPDLAAEHFRRAAQNDPTAADAQTNWGVASLEMKDPASAFEHFRAAEVLDPRAYDPHYNLGQLLLLANRLPAARAEFLLALQARPNDAKALQGLNAAR